MIFDLLLGLGLTQVYMTGILVMIGLIGKLAKRISKYD